MEQTFLEAKPSLQEMLFQDRLIRTDLQLSFESVDFHIDLKT